MFTRLLVPLDRSALAEQALGHARVVAHASGASVELATVHEPIVFDESQIVPLNEARWEEEQRYLEAMAAKLSAGTNLSVTPCLLRGDPVQQIAARARDSGVDLIVMTSHGRTGLSRAWLGSVADGLIRHTSVPVLLLRPVDTPTNDVGAERLFSNVLVPLDGSPRSAKILEPAVALATCCGARLSLLQVVEPVPSLAAEAGFPYGYMPTLIDEGVTQSLVQATRADLEQVAADLRRDARVDVSTDVVVDSSLGRGILEYANAQRSDLIALATRGRGASRVFLGSVADKVLRGSDLPLLVYRPDADTA